MGGFIRALSASWERIRVGMLGISGFTDFFDFLKRWSGFASHHGRVRLHCLQDTAGVPLAYAESPSREHDLQSPGVSTPVGLALLLLPSSALRCLRTRTPTSMGTLEHGGCCCGHGRHSRRIGRATRTEATVSHRGRRHHVVRPPEPHHWRTRASRTG